MSTMAIFPLLIFPREQALNNTTTAVMIRNPTKEKLYEKVKLVLHVFLSYFIYTRTFNFPIPGMHKDILLPIGKSLLHIILARY